MIFAPYKAHKDNSKQTHPSHDLWCWNLENPSDRLFWTLFWVCAFSFAETEFCFEFFSLSYWVLGFFRKRQTPPPQKQKVAPVLAIFQLRIHTWINFGCSLWVNSGAPSKTQSLFNNTWFFASFVFLVWPRSAQFKNLKIGPCLELNNFGNVPFCEIWRVFY